MIQPLTYLKPLFSSNSGTAIACFVQLLIIKYNTLMKNLGTQFLDYAGRERMIPIGRAHRATKPF